jgi:hypothetical protein
VTCAQDHKEADITALGVYQQVDHATTVWRLALHSPGAQSHILIFRQGLRRRFPYLLMRDVPCPLFAPAVPSPLL